MEYVPPDERGEKTAQESEEPQKPIISDHEIAERLIKVAELYQEMVASRGHVGRTPEEEERHMADILEFRQKMGRIAGRRR